MVLFKSGYSGRFRVIFTSNDIKLFITITKDNDILLLLEPSWHLYVASPLQSIYKYVVNYSYITTMVNLPNFLVC